MEVEGDSMAHARFLTALLFTGFVALPAAAETPAHIPGVVDMDALRRAGDESRFRVIERFEPLPIGERVDTLLADRANVLGDALSPLQVKTLLAG